MMTAKNQTYDRCPICRRSGQMMYSDKLVRQLAVHQQWSEKRPKAVCSDCYSTLFAYRFVVLQDARGRAMNEIVITLTEAEFDRLRLFLNDTLYDVRGEGKQDRVRQVTKTVCHNANHLTLKWLDQKREEFA